MLVISYSDFSSDMNKYIKMASLSGLKILPEKTVAKRNSRQKKFLHDLEAVSGILPSDIDFDSAKTEAILKNESAF